MDQLSDEDLMKFFRRKKTEVAYMENPNLFLQLLQDHDLVPEDLFQEVMKMEREKVMYEILDSLEKKGQQSVREFWKCAFQDHMQKKYSVLRSFKQEILGGSSKTCEPHSADKKPNMGAEKGKQKKSGTKTKTSATLSKRNKLPVTCGVKKGTLYPKKLIKVERCIQSEGRWFTPPEFQRFGGKEKFKTWKYSIRYNNITLQKLFKDGHLQPPPRPYKPQRSSRS